MHFFGLWGTLAMLIGLIMVMTLVIFKIIDTEYPVTNRPIFYIALTAMIVGTQLFTAGFIGELISRNAPNRNSYLIEKKSGIDS